MPSLRQIRRRIRSIQNTGKVTKAMEMIAATRMRRAQSNALSGRPYANKLQEVISNLAAQPREESVEIHPLLQSREVKTIQLLHITPDRGLCGGLNSSLNRHVAEFILRQNVPVNMIVVGRKCRDFMVRSGQDVKAVFTNMSDRPQLEDTNPIAHMVISDYKSLLTDEVHVAYGEFVSTAVQNPVIKKLLPIIPSELAGSLQSGYIYEPTHTEILDVALPRYVEAQIYHALLELIASEQSARMVAMRNATESASEMASDLSLIANKVRQESITNELLDIIGGAAALE